jgi:hypothetical protein
VGAGGTDVLVEMPHPTNSNMIAVSPMLKKPTFLKVPPKRVNLSLFSIVTPFYAISIIQIQYQDRSWHLPCLTNFKPQYGGQRWSRYHGSALTYRVLQSKAH